MKMKEDEEARRIQGASTESDSLFEQFYPDAGGD